MGRVESQDALSVSTRPSLPVEADPKFHVLRGRESILRMHAVLVELSTRCGQIGAMDYIALFLDAPMNEKKMPYLLLAATRAGGDPFTLRAGDLVGAAVVYEYRILGWQSGVFVTDDGSGSRTVIALAHERSRLTIKAGEELMRRGARAALLSYKEQLQAEPQDAQIAASVTPRGLLWGSQVRDMKTYLSLYPTFDETVAQLGKHTRRNLRYYRRRTEVELGCRFFPQVGTMMSKEEFRELNRVCTHPVDERIVIQRYDDLSRVKDSFCLGIRAQDGRWLSLMGGRRHHGWTEVDWQINRAGMDRLSLGTVMRCYFLENEVALGAERLYFEGGTPHTMRHSLHTEKAVDIFALRPSWRVNLLRLVSRTRYGMRNFLLHTLADTSIRWQQL